MRQYPGHNYTHFFGPDPMTAAQYFALHAQIVYEDEEMKRVQEKETNKAKTKGRR